MALGQSLPRLAASALRVFRARLELASLDFEEEVLRLGTLLVAALATVLVATLAAAFLGAAIVIFLWDTARLAAVLGVTLAYAAAAAWMGWRLKHAIDAKPPAFAATLEELRKDGDQLEGRQP